MKLENCDFKRDLDRELVKIYKRTTKDQIAIGETTFRKSFGRHKKGNKTLADYCNTLNARYKNSYYYSFFYMFTSNLFNGCPSIFLRILHGIRLLNATDNESFKKSMCKYIKDMFNYSLVYYNGSYIDEAKELRVYKMHENYIRENIKKYYGEKFGENYINSIVDFLSKDKRDIPF